MSKKKHRTDSAWGELSEAEIRVYVEQSHQNSNNREPRGERKR